MKINFPPFFSFSLSASLWAGDSSSQRLDKECFSVSPHSVKDDRSSFSSSASSPAQFFNEATAEKFKQIRTKLQLVDLAGSECAGRSAFGTKLFQACEDGNLTWGLFALTSFNQVHTEGIHSMFSPKDQIRNVNVRPGCLSNKLSLVALNFSTAHSPCPLKNDRA